MSSYSIPEMLRLFVSVADVLFNGLKIFVPLLFLITVFKAPVKDIYLNTGRRLAIVMLLAGNLLFLVAVISNIATAWFHENEGEKELFISIITGPNWYQLVVPILNYALLPLLFWLKPLRKTIFPLFILVMFWLISLYMSDYFTNKNRNSRMSWNIPGQTEYTIRNVALI